MDRGLIGDMARSIGAASLPALKRAAGLVTKWLPIPQPLLLVGPGASARLGQAIADFGHRKLLLVTDADIVRLGLQQALADALRAAGVPFVVFDGVTADAPIPVVEQGLALFSAEACDGIVAVGGGSVMDTAKVIGLAAANRKRPRELAGYFRGRHGPVPIYAVPTTAGTGSEVTVAAVISDPEAGRKYVVADTRIVPDIAALDPALMTGLPPVVSAATGMDALTHAVEAFVSGWATPATDRWALAAARLIWQHLPTAYERGSEMAAREQMALASTYAGLAFTRANVGNVHALAHQLGARYHVPHGLANAMLLPGVLHFTLPAAAPRLARLATHLGLGRGTGGKARAGAADNTLALTFIDAVQALNDRLGIPRTLAALRQEDIAALAEAACSEADLNYPVPRQMSRDDAAVLLRALLPAEGAAPPRAAKRRRTVSTARPKRGGA
jgi:alcohol dehydrogenase